MTMQGRTTGAPLLAALSLALVFEGEGRHDTQVIGREQGLSALGISLERKLHRRQSCG